MGFFKGIFGGDPPQPPQTPGGRLVPDESAGRPVTAPDLERGPFPKSMRVRGSFEEYDLYGRWLIVTLSSAADWDRVKEEVFQAYYKQFGLYNLPDGNQTIRWNEETWRALREDLSILFDPSYMGGPAPSLG